MDQTITLTSAANRVVSAIVAGLERQTVTPNLLRQFRAGDLELSALPHHLANQLRAIARRFDRQHARYVKREHHAANHRVAALAGGGKRECERRRRQIAAGSLTVANGLVAA